MEVDHMLLNIASDCVINDYLAEIKKANKVMPDSLITPKFIKSNYGVDYDRRVDTQYSLYKKLCNLKQGDKDKLKQDADKFEKKLKPKEVNKTSPMGGQPQPQQQYSDDFIKGYTQGIKDVLDDIIDPKTFKPLKEDNDYNKGYNEAVANIKDGLENGIQMSDSANSNNIQQNDGLPQIPWDVDQDQQQGNGSDSKQQDQQQDSQQSPSDRAQDAANKAQSEANKAKDAADKAQKDADANPSNSDLKKRAKDAANNARKAQSAADKAQEAADKAKDLENQAKNASDQKSKDAANKAANKAADKAEKEASNAKSNADDAQEKTPSELAKDAKAEYDRAKQIYNDAKKSGASQKKLDEMKKEVDRAKEASEKAKDAAKRGDREGAKDAANEARSSADITNSIANQKDSKKSDNTSQSKTPPQLKNDKSQKGGNGSSLDNIELSEENARHIKEVIEKYKKDTESSISDFVKKCNSSKKLKDGGLMMSSNLKGSGSWQKEVTMKSKLFVNQKLKSRKEYKTSYERIRRGERAFSSSDMGKRIVVPGKKEIKNKIGFDISLYIDVSASMNSCINSVFKSAYSLCDKLKEDFGRNAIVNNDLIRLRTFIFDTRMREIKYGQKARTTGMGTYDFEELMKDVKKNGSEAFLNIILTDGEFMSVDVNQCVKQIVASEGMWLLVVNKETNKTAFDRIEIECKNKANNRFKVYYCNYDFSK